MGYLEDIRKYELREVMSQFPPEGRLLEIGAGSGWQARLLSEAGYDVEAIDVKESRYAAERFWPVRDYDGAHIPFPDGSFDVIFSSNVLEHIKDLDEFLIETKRVLKTDGLALHIMPSSSWRFWTNLSHYLLPLKFMLKLAGRRDQGEHAHSVRDAINNGETAFGLAGKVLMPIRHGERGNALSEILLYRRAWWIGRFERAGLEVVCTFSPKIFYTGNRIFENRLSIRVRMLLGRMLGYSTVAYVVKKVT
ncbi:MAG: class I SAM-dependent methyltransferase [Gammaproteobacteria bacterium]|jgi:SAM-dependent methyltransferase